MKTTATTFENALRRAVARKMQYGYTPDVSVALPYTTERGYGTLNVAYPPSAWKANQTVYFHKDKPSEYDEEKGHFMAAGMYCMFE